MKARHGFVSNSSSSSFVVRKDAVLASHVTKGYIDTYGEMVSMEECHMRLLWDVGDKAQSVEDLRYEAELVLQNAAYDVLRHYRDRDNGSCGDLECFSYFNGKQCDALRAMYDEADGVYAVDGNKIVELIEPLIQGLVDKWQGCVVLEYSDNDAGIASAMEHQYMPLLAGTGDKEGVFVMNVRNNH